MSDKTEIITLPTAKASLVARMGQRFGVDADKVLATLKATAFKQDKESPEVTNEQMLALLVVADQYNLNPFTRELFAFPDSKRGGIVPVVSVDGWARIVNSHPDFDGVRFEFDRAESCTCIMFRKSTSHAVEITEYMSECKRNSIPWGTHPRRMLRHKAYIQCARIAFGFAGIYDEDEALRILDSEKRTVIEANTKQEVDAVEATRSRIKRVVHQPAPVPPLHIDEATGEVFTLQPTEAAAEQGAPA